MTKFLKIAAALIVIPIIIVIIALTAFFKPIVEAGIHMAGFEQAVVDEASFGTSGTTLKNIRLDGKDNVISEVQLFTSFADIRQGKVSEIYVKGGNLKWPLELPESKSAGPLNLRAVKIDIKNVTVTADTPAGALPLKLEGTVVDSGGVYQSNITVDAETEAAKVNGTIVAITGKNSRRTKLQYKLGETRFIMPDVEMRRVGGFIDAEIDPRKPLPSVNAQLAVGALKLYGLPMEGSSLTISNDQKQTTVILKGEVINKSGSIYADLSIDNTDPALDNMKMRVEAMLKNLSALEIAEMGGEGRFFVTATGSHVKDQPWGDMAQWKNLTGQAGIDMQDLTLPGLIAGGKALATLSLALDPATQKLALFATEGDLSFQGQMRALGNRRIYFSLPQNKAKPASMVWDHREKTVKTSFVGGIVSGFDFSGKWITADLSANLSDKPSLQGTLGIGELRHNAQPLQRFFIPIRTTLKFEPAEGVTKFTGEVTETSGRLYAKVKGQHDFASGKGNASFDMPPTSFASGVTDVAAVFPFTAAYFTKANGTAGLSARLNWSKDAPMNSNGELYLKDMQMTVADDTPLTGVSTVMKLESLSPVIIRQQNIAIGGVNVGLPLTGGLASISLDAKRNLSVHSASWTGAGGSITTTGFVLPLDTMSTKLILNAKGLDLQQLFQIAPLEGLSATGKVDGSLPIEISDGELSINNGSLQTSGTGVIRYSPDKMPAFLQDSTQKQIVDLKAALTQFQYESLGMTLNGKLGTARSGLAHSQKIALKIRGKNPLFYGGKAVHFNLNLDAPLENIIRYSPGSNRIPENIRKQMEAYEAAHGR